MSNGTEREGEKLQGDAKLPQKETRKKEGIINESPASRVFWKAIWVPSSYFPSSFSKCPG